MNDRGTFDWNDPNNKRHGRRIEEVVGRCRTKTSEEGQGVACLPKMQDSETKGNQFTLYPPCNLLTNLQKCDGAQESCSTCIRLGLRCHYKPHLTPKPDQKKLYIAALEDRIAELESLLSDLGHESIGEDHLWREKQNQFQNDDGQAQDDQQNEDYDEPSMTREPAPTFGESDTGKKISVNRVLGSIVKTQKSPRSNNDRGENPPNRSELIASSTIADRLFNGWLNHLSTRYPVVHTPRLRELHARRTETLDVFEESLLHLVYANAGWVLETVRIIAQ